MNERKLMKLNMATPEVHDGPLDEMEAMQLEEPANRNDADSSILQLSEKESQILELYDRLEEINLEISLLQAQANTVNDPTEVVSDKDLQDASERLLNAKAQYALRNSIVESVMIANPVLKAVHAGLNASPIERDLRPLIDERDNLSVSLTEISAKYLSAVEKLTRLEAEHVIVSRRNAELANKMISLAQEANTQKKEDIKDSKVRAQLDELEDALKVSRQRWRIMKGTVSAVVAGSGIDWSRDATLRELVLDTEGD